MELTNDHSKTTDIILSCCENIQKDKKTQIINIISSIVMFIDYYEALSNLGDKEIFRIQKMITINNDIIKITNGRNVVCIPFRILKNHDIIRNISSIDYRKNNDLNL